MNRMSDAEAAELVDRIQQGRWGWKRAFEAWFQVYGGVPDLEVRDGERRVLRDATQFITTNLDNLPALGLAEIVQADGTLQLDTAGEYRYRPVGELPRGFTAYERITT